MWLTGYIAKENQNQPSKGNVTAGSNGTVDFSGSSQYSNVEMAVPFGISYNPPDNEKGIILPCNGTRMMIGVSAGIDESLEPGELRLFSRGGASVTLKNDGKVYINGKAVSL